MDRARRKVKIEGKLNFILKVRNVYKDLDTNYILENKRNQMPRRKFLIISAGICLLLVIITLSYFLWYNSLIEANSEITNFFFIHNWGNTSHEVTVELFNTQNTSVFNESYISVPGETIKSQFPITPVPGVEIKVTLDNNITKTLIVSKDLIGLTLSIDIDMMPNDPLILSPALS